MHINLLHNKIVMDTVTNKFIESFSAGFAPSLSERFGEIDEVILYEDYLSDGFVRDGNFYCPLTLVSGADVKRIFISWRLDKKNFQDMIPYSYIGSAPLEFKLVNDGVSSFAAKIEGRTMMPPKNSIKLVVDVASRDKTFLSGKYSQSFVDAMAKDITAEIEKEFSVRDASVGSLELHLYFAPGTFMEHVSENVCYRRIQISARACAPRDIFIKWRRLDGKGTYRVSDHVSSDKVKFEIASEVPQKIREKEYRYLMAESSDSYRTAMSRKNFTEWRELVKRVIKRGELETLDKEAEPGEAPASFELTNEYKAPEKVSIAAEENLPPWEIETENNVPDTDEELRELLLSVISSDEIEAALEDSEEDEEINPDIQKLLLSVINSDSGINASISEETAEESFLDEVPDFSIDSEEEEENEPVAAEDSESIFAFLEKEDGIADSYESTECDIAEIAAETAAEIAEEPEEKTAHYIPKNDASDELFKENAELLSEIESLKAVLEEKDAKITELKSTVDNERQKLEEAEIELSTLRHELEAKRREEEREKDRIARAAKLAVESEDYIPEEVEMPVYEEETQQEETVEELAEAEENIPEAVESEPEAQTAPISEPVTPEVRYVSKTADIFFRHQIDPNITKRIQEIIVSTVKYFEKDDIYMKVRMSIPEPKTVRVEFVEIPENESALLTDIIRVLGHSKLGITRVILD